MDGCPVLSFPVLSCTVLCMSHCLVLSLYLCCFGCVVWVRSWMWLGVGVGDMFFDDYVFVCFCFCFLFGKCVFFLNITYAF